MVTYSYIGLYAGGYLQLHRDGDLVRGHNEVQRRQKYFTHLYENLGENHSLVILIKNCLSNAPKKRPWTHQLEHITFVSAQAFPLSSLFSLKVQLVLDYLLVISSENLMIKSYCYWMALGEKTKLGNQKSFSSSLYRNYKHFMYWQCCCINSLHFSLQLILLRSPNIQKAYQ